MRVGGKSKVFQVRLNTGNDACRTRSDVAKILRELADRIEENHVSGLLKDENGNRVGAFIWGSGGKTDDVACKWAGE